MTDADLTMKILGHLEAQPQPLKLPQSSKTKASFQSKGTNRKTAVPAHQAGTTGQFSTMPRQITGLLSGRWNASQWSAVDQNKASGLFAETNILRLPYRPKFRACLKPEPGTHGSTYRPGYSSGRTNLGSAFNTQCAADVDCTSGCLCVKTIEQGKAGSELPEGMKSTLFRD